jgi:hypothetical protein
MSHIKNWKERRYEEAKRVFWIRFTLKAAIIFIFTIMIVGNLNQSKQAQAINATHIVNLPEGFVVENAKYSAAPDNWLQLYGTYNGEKACVNGWVSNEKLRDYSIFVLKETTQSLQKVKEVESQQ